MFLINLSIFVVEVVWSAFKTKNTFSKLSSGTYPNKHFWELNVGNYVPCQIFKTSMQFGYICFSYLIGKYVITLTYLSLTLNERSLAIK